MTSIFDLKVYDAQLDPSAIKDEDGKVVELPNDLYVVSIRERRRKNDATGKYDGELVGYSITAVEKRRYDLAKSLGDQGIMQDVINGGFSINLENNSDNQHFYERYSAVDLKQNELFVHVDSYEVTIANQRVGNFTRMEWRVSAKKVREIQKVEGKG